jgi:hypothetical protein
LEKLLVAAIVASLHGLKGMTTIARGLSEKLDGLSSSSDWSCSLEFCLDGYTAIQTILRQTLLNPAGGTS